MKKTIAPLQASPSQSRFARSCFPFPSPSDACHAGYMVLDEQTKIILTPHFSSARKPKTLFKSKQIITAEKKLNFVHTSVVTKIEIYEGNK